MRVEIKAGMWAQFKSRNSYNDFFQILGFNGEHVIIESYDNGFKSNPRIGVVGKSFVCDPDSCTVFHQEYTHLLDPTETAETGAA